MDGRTKLGEIMKWLATGVATLVLAGCGGTPLSPAPSPSATTSVGSGSRVYALWIKPGGYVQYIVVNSDASLTHYPGGRGNVGGPVAIKEMVDASTGRVIRCGRFILTIPPGALDSTGVVTMSLTDSTEAVVDVSVSPSWLNTFSIPAMLSYDTTGIQLSDPVLLFRNQGNAWIDLNAEPDPQTGFPTARLRHFTRFAAGKPGW
ncbi:MAG: hypothetical protein ACM3PF_06435 [Bacteroidota bacterium]